MFIVRIAASAALFVALVIAVADLEDLTHPWFGPGSKPLVTIGQLIPSFVATPENAEFPGWPALPLMALTAALLGLATRLGRTGKSSVTKPDANAHAMRDPRAKGGRPETEQRAHRSPRPEASVGGRRQCVWHGAASAGNAFGACRHPARHAGPRVSAGRTRVVGDAAVADPCRGIWVICAGLVVALAWSYFGKLDIHASRQGRIQPSGALQSRATPGAR